MGQINPPGAFILETADLGLAVAASLSVFASSQKIEDLAAKISLSSTLLTEVGRKVNKNEECFKENFQQRFENIIARCKKDYNTVLAALEKVNSWKKVDSTEAPEEGPPRKPWERLLWALGMKDDEYEVLNDSLDISYKQASMLQCVVSLIIIQIHAQGQDLTPTEENFLRHLKKNMGELLEALRDAGVASIVVFSLAETVMPANAVQVAEATESATNKGCSTDTASSATASIGLHNTSEESTLALAKKEQAVPNSETSAIEKEPEPEDPDVFEIHRVFKDIRSRVKVKQTIFRLFGLSTKVDSSETEVYMHLEKVPATQDEIKDFIGKCKNDSANDQISTFEAFVNISPGIVSTDIYNLIHRRNESRERPRYKWSAEYLMPIKRQNKPFHLFWSRKAEEVDGYIVILRGKITGLQICHQPPPPPSNWPGRPPWPSRINEGSGVPTIKLLKERKPAAKIELTQRETEKVINDFLASFSTLYDGITVEQRGAALEAIELYGKDDAGYDSDVSSSSGSIVLVDD